LILHAVNMLLRCGVMATGTPLDTIPFYLEPGWLTWY
jgi:hypothetical protein